MKNLSQNNLRHPLSRLIAATFALTVIGLAQQSQAQSSAAFSISEDPNVLRASLDFERNLISQADYDKALMDASCLNPASRLFARNQPYLLVQNTSTIADTITSVTIDMTEPGFEFGIGDILADGFNGLLALLSNKSDAGVQLTSASYVNSDSTQLRLNFSGLSAGQAAIVKLDIDQPGGSAYPDYRQALQGADVGNGPGQLATLSTTFGSGPQAPAVGTFARQTGVLQNVGHAEAYHSQTMMTPPPIVQVPEPSSVLLLISGLAAAATRRRR